MSEDMSEDMSLIPMFTEDLLKHLDKTIAAPTYPQSREQAALYDEAAQRRALFQAGMREVVEMLLEWKYYSEEAADDERYADVSETHGTRVAGEDMDVRDVQITAPLRVDSEAPE
jgi:hypothetical protein